MVALYVCVSADREATQRLIEHVLEVGKASGSDRDWSQVHDLLSRLSVEEVRPPGAGRISRGLDPRIVDDLEDLSVYISQVRESSPSRRKPALQRLTQAAAKGKFGRLVVPTVPSLGGDLREVLTTVHELIGHGVTIIPACPEAEVVGPGMRKFLAEVLDWSQELEREKRSTAIKAGQAKVRGKGKRVGRPKRIFDREEVVRLHDEEDRSWSQIAQELGIGAGTARRAYDELKASRGAAKNIGEAT